VKVTIIDKWKIILTQFPINNTNLREHFFDSLWNYKNHAVSSPNKIVLLVFFIRNFDRFSKQLLRIKFSSG